MINWRRAVLNYRDLKLVRRLRAGDERAFAEFFGECFPRLYRFAIARMKQDADGAEEVAQALTPI